MKSYKNGLCIAALLSVCVLAACQTTQGGGDGKWKTLGQSANQNVRHELDTASIVKNGDTVSYRTRATVKDATLEATPNLPVFASAVSTYQMQCRAKTYRITATELRDKNGTVVYRQDFGTQIPQQRITAASPAQKQFEEVCS